MYKSGARYCVTAFQGYPFSGKCTRTYTWGDIQSTFWDTVWSFVAGGCCETVPCCLCCSCAYSVHYLHCLYQCCWYWLHFAYSNSTKIWINCHIIAWYLCQFIAFKQMNVPIYCFYALPIILHCKNTLNIFTTKQAGFYFHMLIQWW